MPNSISDLRAALRARAAAEGFDVVRIARAAPPPGAADRLSAFLAEGRHGGMEWLAREPSRRADPAALWAEAKSVILLGMNYGPAADPLADLRDAGKGAISVYARGEDYHEVIKKKLKRLAAFLIERHGGDARVFVDTAPVLEKALAEEAGIGWQGKHTNLVSRDFGSWLFLGSVFTTLELAADEAQGNRCGACRACLDVCPTGAFPAPYRLDARRCISYLTIEHKGPIPRNLRAAIGTRIYGCDDCLAVCPWNKFARAAHEAAFAPRPELEAMRLADFVRLDDAAFRVLFRRSPIKRIGRDRFIRNVLIAIGNGGDSALTEEAVRLISDPSPLVRGAAVWAAAKLCDAARFGALAAEYLPRETDADVKAEWHDAPILR
jgi:epoxyqueuosine reductase